MTSINTLDDFLALVGEEFALPVTRDDATRPLDEVPGWDSMHLLTLLMLLERLTGRQLSLPDLLDARTMEELFARVAAA